MSTWLSDIQLTCRDPLHLHPPSLSSFPESYRCIEEGPMDPGGACWPTTWNCLPPSPLFILGDKRKATLQSCFHVFLYFFSPRLRGLLEAIYVISRKSLLRQTTVCRWGLSRGKCDTLTFLMNVNKERKAASECRISWFFISRAYRYEFFFHISSYSYLKIS